MRYLAKAIDDFDLVDGVDRRREAPVNTEDLVVDHNAEGKEIEHVGEVMPHIRVAIFARTFGVETIGLGDASRLMISPDQVYAVRVSQFQTDQQ